MTPQPGQRWIFISSKEQNYLLEITSNKGSIFGERTAAGKCNLIANELRTPTNWATDNIGSWKYKYLKGQDKPQIK